MALSRSAVNGCGCAQHSAPPLQILLPPLPGSVHSPKAHIRPRFAHIVPFSNVTSQREQSGVYEARVLNPFNARWQAVLSSRSGNGDEPMDYTMSEPRRSQRLSGTRQAL
ncbi:hypothetical protein Y032_0027g1601 [Ancylostoma ceylanicum]|uniref:Uncharacterized protein n=1 Tax=Ancylostoma ceylanicum TaxID=53326 RepID=A0A016UUY5_9BILA|nr:hypothetical protein Y032_0027g1601 [Ancylostoma ceylanicum]